MRLKIMNSVCHFFLTNIIFRVFFFPVSRRAVLLLCDFAHTPLDSGQHPRFDSR